LGPFAPCHFRSASLCCPAAQVLFFFLLLFFYQYLRGRLRSFSLLPFWKGRYLDQARAHAMRFHLHPKFFCFDGKSQEPRIWSCCHGASIISVTRIQGQEFVQPRCSRAEKMASSRSLMRRRSSARSSGLPSSNSTRLQAVGPNANQDSLGRKQIRKSSVPYRQSPIQSSPDAKWPVRLGRRQRPVRPARCPSPQVSARPTKFQIREPLARLHRQSSAETGRRLSDA